MADNQAELRQLREAQRQEFIAEGKAAYKRMMAGINAKTRAKQAAINHNNWDGLLKAFQDHRNPIETHTDADGWEWVSVGSSSCVGHSKDYAECAKKHVREGKRRGTTTSLKAVLGSVKLFGHGIEYYEAKVGK